MGLALEHARPWAPAGGRLPGAAAASRRAVAALFLINGILIASWVSRIPAIEAAHGFSHATFGLALLALAGGAFVAMPLAGLATVRYGSDVVCRIACLCFCASLPLVALAPGVPAFIGALALMGAFHGALDVAMNAQAVLVEAASGRAIMASFHALFSLGGLLGALAGGVFAAMGVGVAGHFATMAGLLAVVGWAAFPGLVPHVPAAARVVEEDAAVRPAWPGGRLLGLGAIALCIMVGEGAMADWSALYLRRTVETSEFLAAAGYAAFSLAMVAGRLLGDALTERLGPAVLLRLGSVVAAAGLALALACPTVTAVLAGFALVGAGFSTLVPLAFSAAGREGGVSPGVAVASVSTLGYLGFLLGPPIIGFAAELLGLRGALTLLVATTLLPVVFAGMVGKAGAGLGR